MMTPYWMGMIAAAIANLLCFAMTLPSQAQRGHVGH